MSAVDWSALMAFTPARNRDEIGCLVCCGPIDSCAQAIAVGSGEICSDCRRRPRPTSMTERRTS